MAQFLGQIQPEKNQVADALNLFSEQIAQRKAQQQALAQKLIESGVYAPTLGGSQPMGFMDKLKQGFMGPTLGGPSMNMGGQNYQYQTPELKAQALQKQLQAIQGMQGGQPQGQGVTTLGGSNLPATLPNYQISPDIDFQSMTANPKITSTTPLQQAEYQDKILDIQKKQQASKQEASDQALYSQTPEDIKANLQKTNPALVRVGDSIIAGKTSLKDVSMRDPVYKKKLMDYVTSQGINEQELQARNKVRQDYTPGGKVGQQLTTAGTIVQHMAELSKTIGELEKTWGGSAVKPWNQLMQTTSRTFGPGSAVLKKYDTIKNALGGEIDKYYRAGGSAEGGIDRIIKSMDEADTPEAQKASLEQAASLMSGRLGQYVDGWRGVFNRASDPDIPSYLMSDRTKKALSNMGMGDIIQKTENPSGESGTPDRTNASDKGTAYASESEVERDFNTGKLNIGDTVTVGNNTFRIEP